MSGAESKPDEPPEIGIGRIGMDVESVLSLDVGTGTRPTQPPHPQPVGDTSRDDVIYSGDVSGFVDTSGFPDVSGSDITAISDVGVAATAGEIRVPSDCR